jgi:hypothetical protein
MNVDSDTAHVVTRLVVAGSFILAASATAYRRRFGYTLFYILAAIETYAKLRYPASGFVRDLLLGNGPSDAAKYAVQVVALVIAAAIGIAILSMLFRLRRDPAAMTLAIGTFWVVAVLAVETISYHYVDVIIYVVQGGIMRSGWLYVAGALIATVGALRLPARR